MFLAENRIDQLLDFIQSPSFSFSDKKIAFLRTDVQENLEQISFLSYREGEWESEGELYRTKPKGERERYLLFGELKKKRAEMRRLFFEKGKEVDLYLLSDLEELAKEKLQEEFQKLLEKESFEKEEDFPDTSLESLFPEKERKMQISLLRDPILARLLQKRGRQTRKETRKSFRYEEENPKEIPLKKDFVHLLFLQNEEEGKKSIQKYLSEFFLEEKDMLFTIKAENLYKKMLREAIAKKIFLFGRNPSYLLEKEQELAGIFVRNPKVELFGDPELLFPLRINGLSFCESGKASLWGKGEKIPENLFSKAEKQLLLEKGISVNEIYTSDISKIYHRQQVFVFEKEKATIF